MKITDLLDAPTGLTSITDLANGKLTDVLNYAVIFSAVIAVIMMIVSGYMFMTASGDPDKITTAQKTLTASVIGMVIVFIARILVEFVVDLIKRFIS